MRYRTASNLSGFSLLELVIVVVIIGIVAAIAIPRMNRSSQGAAEAALVGDLLILREAIDFYAAEHGGMYPGLGDIKQQLVNYTNQSGMYSPTSDGGYIYGPYLRAIPPLPVGRRKGNTVIAHELSSLTTMGWSYDFLTGHIKAKTDDDEVDASGRRFNEY